MPKGDNTETVQITRVEWNDLIKMVRDMYVTLCGDKKLGKRGMIDEHNDMYAWFSEQKWGRKKLANIFAVLGGSVGLVGGILGIIKYFTDPK